MVKVIFVKKNGALKNSTINFNSVEQLYKKCLFSSNKNFSKRHTWLNNNIYYSIFCKDTGNSGSENKYDLPPPIDSDLFFGNMIILKHNDEEINNDSLQDLTLGEWKNLYEKLFGGFEDLEESEEESEDEYIDPKNLTKQGYDKSDGFIVDDDDSIELESSDEGVDDDNIDVVVDDYDDENDDDENDDDENDDDGDDDDDDDDDDGDYDEKDYLTDESYIAESSDAEESDAEESDAEESDAEESDAGESDAEESDAGESNEDDKN